VTVWMRLKERKLVQWALAYLAGAWVLLQLTSVLGGMYDLPRTLVRSVPVLLAVGFLAALVLAWYHGEKGRQRVSGPELLMLGALLLLAGAAVTWVGGGAERTAVAAERPVGSAIADKSIAVLPFADFSPGGDQEWFSDGLTEEILNALARLPDLRVASRTGSFRFKGSNEEVQSIAASLGMAHILEGSVRRTGERVRITAQLIRASDDVHLWSQNFDRDAADVIRVQEEIAFEIARTMQTALEPEALRAMVSAGTNSVAAYEAYLRGEHLLRQRAFDQAYAAFEDARTLDPQFSDAHLRLALHWFAGLRPASTVRPDGLSYREMMRVAEERLSAAAATATDEVRRVRVEAVRAELDLRLRDALALARRLAELQPQGFHAWNYLGALAAVVGERELAAEAFRRAEGLVEEEASSLAGLAVRYHRVDPDAALRLSERAMALDSTDPAVLYQHHRALLWVGHVREAAIVAEQYGAVGGEGALLVMVQLRQACAEGRTGDAIRLLPALDGVSRWVALTYLGRHAEAAELLRPLDEAGELFTLSGYLTFPFFDARPFPNLSAALRRQRITRPPPVVIPYACRPAEAATSPAAQE